MATLLSEVGVERISLMKELVLYFGCLFLIAFKAQALMVYTLSNHTNAGDHNQALGIAQALQDHAGKKTSLKDLDTKIIPPLKIKKEIEKDLLHERVIVIGSGEGGIDGVDALSSHPSLILCLTSHMFLERYKDPKLLAKVRFIALPTHTPSYIKKQLGVKLIETIGVAHNHQPEDPDTVYEKWGQKVLPSCKTYLGVMLGGDAPTLGPGQKIKFFTEEDAVKLAGYIAQSVKDTCVLVLNGPRTGKYDKAQKEILTVHRKGHSDPITRLFEHQLAHGGVKNIKVFDFQHNIPDNQEWILPYNSFELVVGALKATQGYILIPGDSTSMISEALDMLPPNKVIAYETGAMNEVHKSHLMSELAMGRISILEGYHHLKEPILNPATLKSNNRPLPAAVAIAQKIWEEVMKEHKP